MPSCCRRPVLRKAWRQWERRRTMQQMEKALRVADNIVFAFDGDEAGRRAVGKALEGLLPALADGTSAFFFVLTGR